MMSRRNPKRTLGRFELPVKRFCDVAVPSYVDLLGREKKEIIEVFKKGESDKCLKAIAKARSTCNNVKAAIAEIEALKNDMTNTADAEEFVRRITPAKKKLEGQIMELAKLMRDVLVVGSQVSEMEEMESTYDLSKDSQWGSQQIFDSRNRVHDLEASIERRVEQLEMYQKLERDAEDIGVIMREISRLVHDQAYAVDSIENNVSVAQVHLHEGVKNVKAAAKMQVAAFPVAGALLGSCIGGPVGLLVGAKVGGLVAFGGAVVGYVSGKLVKNAQTHGIDDEQSSIPADTTVNRYIEEKT